MPEEFACAFCTDIDLTATPWADTVAAQIRAQLEDHDDVGSMELAIDGGGKGGDEVPECWVILCVHPLPPHAVSANLHAAQPCPFTPACCPSICLGSNASSLAVAAF